MAKNSFRVTNSSPKCQKVKNFRFLEPEEHLLVAVEIISAVEIILAVEIIPAVEIISKSTARSTVVRAYFSDG